MKIRPYFYKFVIISGAVFVWAMMAVPSYNQAGSIIFHGEREVRDGNSKIAALTFDDGPYGEPTEKVLEILKEKNVKATFFVVGENAQKYPELVKKEAAGGHLIANHSYDHAQTLAAENYDAFKKNTLAAEQAIFSASGLHPRFYRPPFGLTSVDNQKVLADLGYQTVMWSDMTNDWEADQPAENLTARIIKRLKPGAIIVMHDGRDTHIGYPRENMLRALPVIIDKIRAAGYEIVSLDQLTGQNPYFPIN